MSRAAFDIRGKLLGDSCWPEPALSALGEQRGEPVRLFVGEPAIRRLYSRNRWIDTDTGPGGIPLDENRAWRWAVDNKRYFAEGFFEQVGAELWDDSRIGPRFDVLDYKRERRRIVICPFSASCLSGRGQPPNKTMPPAWWEGLVSAIRDQVAYAGDIVVLGGKDQPGIAEGHNLIKNVRGIDLSLSASIITSSRLLVTVETWAAVLAGGKEAGNVVMLGSATPPSLHLSREMEARGNVDYLWARHPWEWDQGAIVDKIKDILGRKL